MSDATGILCFLLVALAIITLVGHGIWLLLAALWRLFFGPLSGAQRRRFEEPENEWNDLAAARRQIRRLAEQGDLEAATYENLLACLNRRRRQLLGEDYSAGAPQKTEKPQEPIRSVPAEPILEVLPVEESERAPQPVLPPPLEPTPLPPPRPRRSLGEVLAAFMEERNILWGELAGGLLIVGCSVALVVYLWQTQKQIPYFPFFIVAGVTASLFGAGLYTLRRWKLETTSRGLLIIATLLVPLSFLVMAGLSKGEAGGWLEIVTEAAAVGVFAWLVSQAGKVLAGPKALPGQCAGRWLLAAAVIVPSVTELLVPRLIDPDQPPLWSLVALGLVTTACHFTAMAAVLTRAQSELQEAQAPALFAFLGMATFPLAVALGFLVYWCEDPKLALERIAAFVALGGVPVLATGVLVFTRPAIQSGSLRTAATAIALGGMFILLAAVAMAWPQPGALILVCLIDFMVLSTVAWGCHWPVAHAAALPCLAVGYLTAYHLVTGALDVDREELGRQLLDRALTPVSGVALTVLAVVLAAAAEGMIRLARRRDALYHAVGAAVAAGISLALVTGDDFIHATRVAIVYGVCAATGFLVNLRWRQFWLTFAVAAVSLGAIAFALHAAEPDLRPARLWSLALLLEATAALAGSLALKRFAENSLAVPLRLCFLLASVAAIFPLLAAMERSWMGPLAGLTAWLALLWLILAWFERWQGLFTAFQAMLGVAVLFGVTAWLDDQAWVSTFPEDLADPRSLQAYGVALGLLALLTNAARLLLRKNERAIALLEPPWPSVDRVVAVSLVLGLLGLAIFALAPGVGAELSSAASARASSWPETFRHAAGPGAWLVLATLVAGCALGQWNRRRHESLVLLALLAPTLPLLVASQFTDDRATASALRWGLALWFLACSAPFWLRDSIAQWTSGWGFGGTIPKISWELVRAILLLGLAIPVLILTATAAGLRISGEPPGGPGLASIFARMDLLVSNLVPLCLVALGLTGYGVRERSAGYVFSAGLVITATVMGGYVLGVVTSGGEMQPDRWVLMLQLGTLAGAIWAGLWLASRPWLAAWREELANPLAKPLMNLHLALGIAGYAILILLVLGQVFVQPGLPMPAGPMEVGQITGWLSLLATAGVVFWYVSQSTPSGRIHVIAVGIISLAVLSACTLNPAGLAWRSYHVLIAAMAAGGLAFLGAGLVAAKLRLIGAPQPPPAPVPIASEEISAKPLAPASSRMDFPAILRLTGLGELLPAQSVGRWLQIMGTVLGLFALRGGWTDPQRTYWSAGGVLTASVLAAGLAVWFGRQRYVYACGLLVNLAGILIWSARGPEGLAGFLAANVLCLGIAAFFWSALDLVLKPRFEAGIFSKRVWPFPHVAVAVGLALMAWVVVLQCILPPAERLTVAFEWLALGAMALACVIPLWDSTARFILAGLYVLGVLGLALLLGDLQLSVDRFWQAAALVLAGYVACTSALGCWSKPLSAYGRRLGWPERTRGWPVEWFPWLQLENAAVVTALSFWMVLAFASRTERLLGPAAASLLVVAAIFLSGAPGRLVNARRFAALALGVVALTELGWSLLDPAVVAPWLHRNAVVLVVLAALALAYGSALPALLRGLASWPECCRKTASVLAILASVQLLVLLGHEAALYNPDPQVRTTPLAWWGILAVAVGFGLLVGATLQLAVSRQRPSFVYVAEIVAVLLLVHLRLNVPDLFPRFIGRYWTLVVMGIAFVGVGLGEWFERRGLRVVGEPLRRTGVFLPLLPLLAFWVRDLTGVHEALVAHVPALSPVLRYLQNMEGGFTIHALVWFVLGMLYAAVAVSRRSFHFALLAALAANFGLWVIFANVEGLHFIAHPQLWLIPVAIILLAAEHLNRDKLGEPQAAALRYLALTLLYLSSTADMFLAGIGNSVVLPMVLALLSVLGILLGILLRVRAFLFQGVTFLFVVVFTMIWLAAVKRGQTWVWFVFGIVLGAAIVALFALFEKRRNDVTRVVEELKKWE